MAESSSCTGSSLQSSIRYDRLIEMMEKALARSRSGIDVKGLIQECYGNDDDDDDDNDPNNIVAGTTKPSTNQVFQTMLEGVLDKSQKTLVSDMIQYLEQENIPEILYRFEAVINKLDYDAECRKQANLQDKESAIAAAKRVKLDESSDHDCHESVPNTDVLKERMHHVIVARAYDKLFSEYNNVQDEVLQLEKELAELEHRQQVLTVDAQERLNKIQSTTRYNLDKAADICSSVLS